MMFQTLTASLHQATRSTGCAAPFISPLSALIGAFTVPARSCSLSGPLLYHSLVVFLDLGHPRSFYYQFWLGHRAQRSQI